MIVFIANHELSQIFMIFMKMELPLGSSPVLTLGAPLILCVQQQSPEDSSSAPEPSWYLGILTWPDNTWVGRCLSGWTNSSKAVPFLKFLKK